MESFAIILIGLIAGLLLRRSGQFPANTAEVLNRYVIWIALPALILDKTSELTFDLEMVYPMSVAWTALLTSAVFVVLLGRYFQWSPETRCVLLLLVPLGNTSFVGIPLVTALLGDSAVKYAILYDQLGSFLALALYGSLILSIYSNQLLSIQNVFRNVVTFPPFIALTVALVAKLFEFSLPFHQAIAAFGATLVPVVMVAVGYQWQFRLPKHDALPFTLGLTIKLVLMPLLVWQGLQWFALSEVMMRTLVLESAMAPMISAGALLISEGQNPRLAAAMVGYGLLFGLMSVPVIHYWVI
jgi:hypothetical protein